MLFAAGNAVFVYLNRKTDTNTCHWPVCLSTGQCFLVVLLAFHSERAGEETWHFFPLILKHSERVTGVMKSNIYARSHNPCQLLLPPQAEALGT